jgi:hypothetical protein
MFSVREVLVCIYFLFIGPLSYHSFTQGAVDILICRSQWPSGLSRRSAAARLLRLWVRIPPGGKDVCCECCVLSSKRSLQRADHSSRGVLPTVLRRCVWSRNFVNEEALAHWGLLCQKERKKERNFKLRILYAIWLICECQTDATIRATKVHQSYFAFESENP